MVTSPESGAQGEIRARPNVLRGDAPDSTRGALTKRRETPRINHMEGGCRLVIADLIAWQGHINRQTKEEAGHAAF